MDKSLSISNFRKIFVPKEIILAAIMTLFIETSSWLLLTVIKYNVGNEESLIKLDQDFFCRNLKKYAPYSFETDKKYAPKIYDDWEEIKQDGPYDIIVFGTSVGNSGWVERLRLDYGLKICNLTFPDLRSGGIKGFIKTMGDYKRINNSHKALLLYVDLTEGTGSKLGIDRIKGDLREAIKAREGIKTNIGLRWKPPSIKLIEYVLSKLEYSNSQPVKVINLDGKDTLFFTKYLQALSKRNEYSPEEYLELSKQFKEFKKISAEQGCIFAMIGFPTKPQMYEWLLIKNRRIIASGNRSNLKILKKITEENEIPFLDIEEKLKNPSKDVYINKGKLLWERYGTHLNELGNQYAAEAIKQFIDDINKRIKQ